MEKQRFSMGKIFIPQDIDDYCSTGHFSTAFLSLNPPNDSAETDSGLVIRDIPSLQWEKWPTDAVRAWLIKNSRFHFHFAPTYSFWMNMVKRWFSELTTKMLRRSTHKSEKDLIKSINTWIAGWNENPKPFNWVKTVDEVFTSMEKYLSPLSMGTSE